MAYVNIKEYPDDSLKLESAELSALGTVWLESSLAIALAEWKRQISA